MFAELTRSRDVLIPADSVFHLANLGRFDAVLSLYHDQGHIAAKMLDFERTVSITTGLYSYFNDSYFWVVSRLLGIENVKEQTLTWSIPTTIRMVFIFNYGVNSRSDFLTI
jgi:hypothetical protein